MLTRLIYHSENHLGADGSTMLAGLNDILAVSQRNNHKAGLTGALLFDTLWFVQILEGDREAVSAALLRIAGDPRHDALTVMDCRAVDKRLFGNWSMGFAMLRGDNGALFARHGINGSLNPRIISGEQALSLAVELAARRLDSKAAA